MVAVRPVWPASLIAATRLVRTGERRRVDTAGDAGREPLIACDDLRDRRSLLPAPPSPGAGGWTSPTARRGARTAAAAEAELGIDAGRGVGRRVHVAGPEAGGEVASTACGPPSTASPRSAGLATTYVRRRGRGKDRRTLRLVQARRPGVEALRAAGRSRSGSGRCPAGTGRSRRRGSSYGCWIAVSSWEASAASVAPPPIAWRTSVACLSDRLPGDGLVGQDRQDVRRGGGELVRRPGRASSGRPPPSARAAASAEVGVAPDEVVPERGALPWMALGERGQGGVELSRMEADEQVIEVAERRLQRGGLRRVSAGIVCAGLEGGRRRVRRRLAGRCRRRRRTRPGSRLRGRRPGSRGSFEGFMWSVTRTSPPGTDCPG